MLYRALRAQAGRRAARKKAAAGVSVRVERLR